MMLHVSLAGYGFASNAQPGEGETPRAEPPGTGIVYSDVFLRHNTGNSHPETASRLKAVMSQLAETKLLNELAVIKPEPASPECMAGIHSENYIEEVKKACAAGARYLHSPDTPISGESYNVALHAAGAVLTAIDAVMQGKVRNAFCAVRPPGHHALHERAMGFCLFNNVAIGAGYLLEHHDMARVAIVDWDVHHGNGTQEAFYHDPRVLFISLHQYPFYPGSGHADEAGSGDGLGFTLNIPMPHGSGDEEYLEAFEKQVRPELINFEPEFILVSAGFDAHRDDPLGGQTVSSEGFARMTRILKDTAADLCRGRMVSVLEGGYDHEALARSVYRHLKELAE